MKLQLALCFATCMIASACVPAGDDPEPRGAGGFHVVPSPAAQGFPFVTADGWIVRFERVALAGFVSSSNGSAAYFRWNGALEADLYSPAGAPGPALVSVQLAPAPVSQPGKTDERYVLDAKNVGLDDATIQRFTEPADDLAAGRLSRDEPVCPIFVASIVGIKGDRTVRVELALAGFGVASASTNVEVTANALATDPLQLTPERILSTNAADANEARASAVSFRQFEAADRLGNGDGIASIDELNDYTFQVNMGPALGSQPMSLLELLANRLVLVFGSQSILGPS